MCYSKLNNFTFLPVADVNKPLDSNTIYSLKGFWEDKVMIQSIVGGEFLLNIQSFNSCRIFAKNSVISNLINSYFEMLFAKISVISNLINSYFKMSKVFEHKSHNLNYKI